MAKASAAAVQNPPETTGGITGKGFKPGASGNPGGRPKGLARLVREQVGNDGLLLVQVMLSIMSDPKASDRDRMEAIKWLSDRGWGKAPVFAPMESDDPLELSERAATEIAGRFATTMDELARRRAERG
jgi:hypothetical protein